MTLPRFFRDLRYRLFYGLVQTRRYRLETLGSRAQECDWNIYPGDLSAESIIYSGGVGNDITFEHALVERFGCRVVLFDPSPTGLATMARPENQRPEFTFCPVALAGHCGHLAFQAPQHAEEGSYFAGGEGSDTVRVPCTTLAALMRAQGHSQLDLLKIDIEGSELDVLSEIVRERLPVRQICVEFHHGLIPGFRRSQTVRAILSLRRAGYELLDQTGNNHTFRAGAWPAGQTAPAVVS